MKKNIILNGLFYSEYKTVKIHIKVQSAVCAIPIMLSVFGLLIMLALLLKVNSA
jgi:hypothetical protein